MKNIQNQEADNIALFAMIAWFLWTSRDEARVGGTRKQAVQIVRWAKNYLDEYQIATLWCFLDLYKVNVDGAVLNEAGVNIVVRDQISNVAAAMSKKFIVRLGPLEVKAKATEEAIQFAWQMGFYEVQFEGDSQLVIHSLLGLLSPPTSILNIIFGSLQHLNQFRSLQFACSTRKQ